MPAAWPEPTRSEIATLTFHVTDWGNRSRAQQSICLAILRGHCHVPEIAKYLQIGMKEVASELKDLIGQGLLWDNQKLLFH